MKRLIAIASLALLMCTPCIGQDTISIDNHIILNQKGGKTIGYSPASGVTILQVDGLYFKDLNKNGTLDKYEDWRLSSEERAADLAKDLSLDEIAGLMLYSRHMAIPHISTTNPKRYTYSGVPWLETNIPAYELSDQQIAAVKEGNLRQILVTKISSPVDAAKWNNRLQALAESLPHGIPTNNSSDPRNETRATDEFNAGSGGEVSLWPTPLGLGATFDPEVARDFAKTVQSEYRALGITTALSPQADIYTEPRWRRGVGCFSEDPRLAADMTKAYIDGFQTSYGEDVIEEGWGKMSVNCMVKHWPGGGSGEAGRDAHLCFGKYAVFPGENLDTNIFVFNHGAFKLDGPTKQASAVMPYYTISYAQDPSGKNVANAFSKYIIQDLLYDTYKYKGVVCTDWSITRDYTDVHIHGGKPWGVEGLSVDERHYEVIKAGCDQFGGNDEKGPVIAAYNMWVKDFGEESARARFEHSAKKLLLNFFRTGLFENPYLDPAETAQIVGNKESREHGYLAQLKSVVMLKNHDKTLPLSNKPKVYIPKRQIPNVYNLAGKVTVAGSYDYPIDPAIVTDYYEMTTPDEADFAIVVIGEPVNGRGFDTEDIKNGGNGYVPMSLQYGDYKAVHARKESIAAGDPKEATHNRSYRGKTIKTENAGDIDLIIETRKAIGKDKPLIVILPCSKPVIMKEFEKYADAILVSFGVQPQAYLDIISGKFEPSGLLPIQFPADMKTVEQQFEDTPRDMKCYKDADGNIYDFAFGMNWNGVINDERVKKYR